MHSTSIVSSSSFFAVIFAILTINVQGAPLSENKRETSNKIQCGNPVGPFPLKQVGYLYGGYPEYQVAEEYDELPSTGSIYGVQPEPSNANLAVEALKNVTQVQCNSTSLNYFSQPNVYGTNIPVKLITSKKDRNGKQLCVGLQNGPDYSFDASTNKSFIALVPCSDEDTVEAQGNQFWANEYKYATLLPLVGKIAASVESKEYSLDNYWAIAPPSDTSEANLYTAVGNINPEILYDNYVSFQ